MRHGRCGRVLLFLAILAAAGILPVQAPAQFNTPQKQLDEPDDKNKGDAEEERERLVAERFRKLLESNPRRGTALDRLYGYHVERGTLDRLVDDYASRTKENVKDGVAWMIVGLLESQRGRDGTAVAAFQQAETNLPENGLPCYYLGQSLILVGQADAAAAAFERAISRKPSRIDLLDAFQALGRVYQRSQQSAKALEVWNRLEKLYPDDARVQEQIASTLVEEGQFEQALPRLVKLADQADDKYRQTALRMDAADLKVKLKKSSEAIADFEKLLGELNPESWLYRDVRRRIEEVFLRNDDLAGLAKYYEKWLEKNKTDVDAIARLAKTLATQGRAPEARDWLSKGVAVAPNNRALRQALIDQFVFEQNFAAAAQQYEAMDKADPNNPDTLRDWGKLLMRDVSKSEAERRALASAIWRRLLEKKPKDPVIASQTADLMRTAGAVEDAIALYKKAIELAPNAAQYREYLGEYYHSLKRPEDALSTWRPMAEGRNRTSKNLARLAEVFAGFGYRKEAATAMADAISLEKDDFGMIATYAELLHLEGDNQEALKQLGAAAKLSSNEEETEQILLAQIKIFQATENLVARIDELQAELDVGKDATAERWLRLARYYEANRQLEKAIVAYGKAQAKDAKSIAILIAGARLYEMAGNLLGAADTNRKLAVLDRRYRTEYLTAVTKLEQRLGRREQTLQSARDLLAASPGNPDVYKFFADLCFQLGDQEEGLEALRRSIRANPSDPQGLISLANALSERARQGEAIELLWRAFEKTPELDAKLGVIERIAQLYLENNQFDRLLERLERDRREADKVREATLCLAQAYTTAGDLGEARQQLERLLTENTRDTHLLSQLSTLCEQEGDLAAAVKYQRQLGAAAGSNHDHQLRLAQLLTRTGEQDEAADLWVKLASKDAEPHRNLESIDNLVNSGKNEAALAILARMLAQKPGDWELVYREGAALEAMEKHEDAAQRFSAILALKSADDELGEIARHQIEQAKKKPLTPALQMAPRASALARSFDESALPPLSRRISSISRIRMINGMDQLSAARRATQQRFAPVDYGEARIASLAWLYEAARSKGTGEEFVKQLRIAKDQAGAEPRALWDWYYFNLLRNEGKQVLPTAMILARGADPAGLLAYVNAVETRTNAGVTSVQIRRARAAGNSDLTPPLSAEQLALLQQTYLKLQQTNPAWAPRVVQTLMAELKRAGKDGEEKALYQAMLQDANVISKVETALGVAAGRNDLEACLQLFERLEKLQPPAKTSAMLAQLPTRQAAYNLTSLMGKRADAKQMDDVRRIVDLYLTTARRQNLIAVRSASSTRRQQSTRVGIAGVMRGSAALSYPTPNDYYDAASITILSRAFELHKKADVISDLFAHFEKRRDAARGAELTYAQLALGYLHWWALEKDEAITELNRAVEGAPNDNNLLLEVVGLRELNNDFAGAMALLDSFTPLDMQTMQQREETALRLAERTGDIDRARKAADRLFGLRLDSTKQLELAGKMHRLGMHELAETVLGRAQRQAGNKTAMLAQLMNQYQSQNQTENAVQIARQILHKASPVQRIGPSGNVLRDENEVSRTQAITVLARSGQLKETIERTEAQLKASPKSSQIYQSLVGYYQASGDKQKLRDALLKMAELKPTDGRARYQAAQQLQQMGERDAALEQYKLALKFEPSLLRTNFAQIQNMFAQANKFEELVQLLDGMDLRKTGNLNSIMQPISNLLNQGGGRGGQTRNKELGLKLFRKAWEAFPQSRSTLLSRLYSEDLWQLPEIYQFAKEAVIPREDSEGDPWEVAVQYSSIGQQNRLEGVLTRLLAITRKQQRLPELRQEVAGALQKRPDWVAGKALLAVIDIQMGAKEQGKKEWQLVFDDPKADVPGLARFILCQELEFYAGVEGIAIKAMEGGIDEVLRDGNFQFSYSPARKLAWWYELTGRNEDARKLLLRMAGNEGDETYYQGGYSEYLRVENGIAVAQELVRAGDPVEAVRLYNRMLADPNLLDQANQYFGSGGGFDKQVEDGLKEALKALKPETLPAALSALVVANRTNSKDKPALDLVLLVDSRDFAKATLSSLFATAIKATDKAPVVRRETMKKLAELTKNHPTDFSVLTAHVLAELAGDDPSGQKEAVDRLVKLVESTPLDPLPRSSKPNARQRAEAKLQTTIWLAARECLAKDREILWPAGDKLAARAAAAAKRQPDAQLTSAIFREWGQLELDRGNKEAGQAHWTELLEWKLAQKPAAATEDAQPVSPGLSRPVPARRIRGPVSLSEAVLRTLVLVQQPQPPAARRARGAAGQPAGPRSNPLTLTEEQFKATYDIAVLAIDKQMPDLCLRAMKDALRGGPPVVVSNDNRALRGGGALTPRIINGTQYYVRGGNEKRFAVDRALLALASKMRAQNVPPAQIYDLLVSAVVPQARAKEVFLYVPTQGFEQLYLIGPNGALTPTTDMPDDSAVDRGLGNALIQAALDSGKVEDLRGRLEARLNQPLAELPANILLAMLALQAKDEVRAKSAFGALSDRLKKDSTQGTNAAVAALLLQALTDPALSQTVLPILDKAAQNYLAGGNAQAAAELRFKLAEYYVYKKDEAGARAKLKFVESAEKRAASQVFDMHLALANEYLKLGWVEDALGELAYDADRPFNPLAYRTARRTVYYTSSELGSEPSISTPGQFERLAALLLNLPAARRYETLKAWSLPTSGRKSIRYYVGQAPRHSPPEIFAKRLPFSEIGTMSTMLIMAEAAKEVGKLEELTATVDALAKEKIENGDLLRVLVYLTNGKAKDPEPVVQAFSQKSLARLTKKQELPIDSLQNDDGYLPPAILHPSEFLFATLCLTHPTLAAHGGALLGPMSNAQPGNTNNHDIWNRLPALRNLMEAKRAGAPHALDSTFPPHWSPLTFREGWLAQDGYLKSTQSNQSSSLLFDVPLTGTFELTVETHPPASGVVGYGGVNFHPNWAQVESLVPGDTVQVDQPSSRQQTFAPMTIQVTPGKIRCLVDGQVFYEDVQPAPTSPWLMLGGGQGGVYRRAALSGHPVVPAEIRLSSGDYLEGWQENLYGRGLLPKRLVERRKAEGNYVERYGRGGRRFVGDVDDDDESETGSDPAYEWLAKDGEIRGSKISGQRKKALPSNLAYFRPLHDGEKLRYEFFYQPGSAQVHPSLGRVAFLLEPEGLKLHWMTEPQGDWTGLEPDNAVVPAANSASRKLRLKPGEWNAASVEVVGDSVRIELNGAMVYEAKLEPENDRRFGLFHYRDRSEVRVRNVVLSGKWSQALATQENMTLAANSGAPADVKVRRGILGEALFAAEAGVLIERTRALPAEKRFEQLADWVLPNNQRPTYQLAGVLKPLDVLGVVDQKQQPAGRRVLQGGRLDLPGLELIAAAKEAHKLAELCERLAKSMLPSEEELDRRSRLALLAAALAAKGDDPGAAASLRELLPYLSKLKLDANGAERWPDLVAVNAALDRVVLGEPVAALLQAANQNLEQAMAREKVFADRDWWLRAFRDARARAELTKLPVNERWSTGSESRFQHWESVTTTYGGQVMGMTRRQASTYVPPVGVAQGAGIPRWALRDGAVVHFPGHGDDFLIFDTPLRGDFEVACELTLDGWEEMYVRYGAREFALLYDRKNYRMHKSLQGVPENTLITPPLPAAKGKAYQFRLAVKDGWFRALIDGREIIAEKIGPEPDPWLMLHCLYMNTGAMRKLKISGTPVVPERINLLADDELGLWRMERGQWIKRGEEMYSASQRDEIARQSRSGVQRNLTESASFYLRPLLEDGAVEYEFFYDPDKALVHPMLNRLTFLLEPEGVKLHWLTDGFNERSDKRFDNAADEPSCRRGPSRLPLKAKAWNRVRLAVAGDVVKLVLNGVEIYERPIESTNQRQFGLFHFTDRTDARVRSMTYTGAWPKKLPPEAELFELKK